MKEQFYLYHLITQRLIQNRRGKEERRVSKQPPLILNVFIFDTLGLHLYLTIVLAVSVDSCYWSLSCNQFFQMVFDLSKGLKLSPVISSYG